MSTGWRWLRRLLFPNAPVPELAGEESAAGERPAGQSLRWQQVWRNPSLLLGGIVVTALFVLALVGPLLAPRNPYLNAMPIPEQFDAESGHMIRPPLEPSAEYPLGTDAFGNDLLSLVLHGARVTLVAAGLVTFFRILLGLSLGALAGWTEGRWPDQVIMALTVILTSIPMLFSSMVAIFALGIEGGMSVFVIALTLVGWTEIAQFVRGEFIVIRRLPFIEGARAVGLRGLQIAIRHVIPNVLPQLLIVTFLEMGAVLILLAELGFMNVFIGGGSTFSMADLLAPPDPIPLVEMPEWGALIAQGVPYVRPAPFVIFVPALAFLIAVLGFNAFGEGLRSLIEKTGISLAFLFKRRALLVAGLVVFATYLVMARTSPERWYLQAARQFDGRSAAQYTTTLADIQGRAGGQAGGPEAAAYIEEQFRALDLAPGWKNGFQSSYEQVLTTTIVRPQTQPVLELVDENGATLTAFQHQVDFGYVIDGHGGSGATNAPITFVGVAGGAAPLDWTGLDVTGRVVMAVAGQAPDDLATVALSRGAQAMLWVTEEDPVQVRSQLQLANPLLPYLQAPTLPIFRIRPAVAAALLEAGDASLADLLTAAGRANDTGWFQEPVAARVRMSLTLAAPQDVEVTSVFGYIPGYDFEIADELIVVFGTYDSLGIDPDGTVFDGANDSASSIGVMMEIARMFQQEGFNPRRSIIFVAWGAGQLDLPEPWQLLLNPDSFNRLTTFNPRHRVFVNYVLSLDDAGAGSDEIWLSPDGDPLLNRWYQETAAELGVPVTTAPDGGRPEWYLDQLLIPWTHSQWAGEPLLPDADVPAVLEPENLRQIGQVHSLLLMKLALITEIE